MLCGFKLEQVLSSPFNILFEWLFKGFFKCCLSNVFWNLFLFMGVWKGMSLSEVTLYSPCVLEFSIILNAKGSLKKQKQCRGRKPQRFGTLKCCWCQVYQCNKHFCIPWNKALTSGTLMPLFWLIILQDAVWKASHLQFLWSQELVFSQSLWKIIQSLMLTLNLKGKTISFIWSI